MRILDVALKDIQQILRDWKSALFLVAMPVLFTLFFGLVFGPVLSGRSDQDYRLPVGLLNLDSQGLVSSSLETLLAQSNVIRHVELTEDQLDQGREMVEKGELAAVVIIPEGYTQSVLVDRPASMNMIVDQSTTSGGTAVTALDTVAARLLGAVESAHISAETYQIQVGFQYSADRIAYLQAAFQTAVSAWENPPLTVQVEPTKGQAVPGTEIKITGFTQSSAGMIVQFAVFGLINSAMLLVLERKNRCLQRLLTTPIRRAEIIGGHIMAMFGVVFTQELILVALGQGVFGVNYMRQPLAILVMMVALALFASSLGLLIGTVAKHEDQVIVLCLIAMFLFSAMGGAWFPLDVAGKTFAAIGHLLPSAWAMDGFQNIVLRGLGFSSILTPATLLLAYTLAFFGLAIWGYKFE